MGVTNSIYMSLPVPQVGNEAGPQYAQDVNNCLTIIDQHNHSAGQGQQVTPNGLNINADLPMNGNNLTTARSARFNSQPGVITNTEDVGCLYEVINDLYFNDGLGNNIRLTQAGAVAGTPGSISNLVPPASVAYVTISKTVVFQSDVNTSANLDAGFIILRNNTLGSAGLTLSAPPSIASDYSIALPLLPGSNMPVSVDQFGTMTAAPLTQSELATTVSQALNPPGAIIMYGGSTAPAGYLLCDGTSYLKATYPDLYSAIGNAFGTADGTHFNVPDMRGQFPRGVDSGAGRDPDAAFRTAMNPGGNTGDNVGSIQPDDLESHAHSIPARAGSPGSAVNELLPNNSTGSIIAEFTYATGGNETRPTNAYVNFIIKV